jgi:3-oxoacyl-[acyl-carrier protein] reductase
MSEANNQRVAIVTGAARGIGAAVATRLAADGHAVAVVDLDEVSCKSVATTIADNGGTAVAVAADVSDETSVADATAAVADQLGVRRSWSITPASPATTYCGRCR